jgi:hypothetical protein
MRTIRSRNRGLTAWGMLGLLLVSAVPLGLLTAQGHPPAPALVPLPASPAGTAATRVAEAQASLATGITGPSVRMGAGPSSALTWTNVSYRAISPYTGSQIANLRAAAATYDARDGYVFLFGGESSDGWFDDSSWTYANATWSNVGPLDNVSTGGVIPYPAPRSHAGMAYDARDGYVLMFGGYGWSDPAVSTTNRTSLNDTWAYAGGNWTDLTGGIAPSPRSGAAMTYDPVDGRVVLFGGYDREWTGSMHPLNDTWEFAAGHWTNVTSTAGAAPPTPANGWPAPVASPSFAWDSRDGYAVLVDPSARTWSSETWTFVNGSWANRTATAGALPFRVGAGLAYDAQLGGVVRVGGGAADDYAFQNDTWAYLSGGWSLQAIAGAPPGFQFATATYDPGSRCVVVSPGETSLWQSPNPAWYNSTWSLCGSQPGNGTFNATVTPTGWTDHTNFSRATPTYLLARTMTYDAHDGYVLLYDGVPPYRGPGGWGPAQTWSYANGTWTNLTSTAGTPPPACGGCESMTYDSTDRYVLLYETSDVGNNLRVQTWKFFGGVWTNLTAGLTVQPPVFALTQFMADDSGDGYVLLYGVDRLAGSVGETWSYAAGRWSNLTSHQTESPPYVSAWAFEGPMTYDSADGYILFLLPNYVAGRPVLQFYTFTHGLWSNATIMRGAPAWRYDATMEYDAFAKGVVLFGGIGRDFQTFGDTWLYSGGNWTHIVDSPGPTTAPSPRTMALSAYDPGVGCVQVYGGDDPAGHGWGYLGFQGELWSYCGNPVNRSPTIPPPGAAMLQVTVVPARASGPSPLVTDATVAISGGTAPFRLDFCAVGTCRNVTRSASTPAWVTQLRFETTGAFVLSATVVDQGGQRGVASATVLVAAGVGLRVATGELARSSGFPAAFLFWANVTGGAPPYTVQWSFGDGASGSTVSGVAGVHSYLAPGDFTPEVAVADATGELLVVAATPIHLTASSKLGSSGAVLASWSHVIVSASGAAVGGVIVGALFGGYAGVRFRARRDARAVVDAMRHRTPPERPAGEARR